MNLAALIDMVLVGTIIKQWDDEGRNTVSARALAVAQPVDDNWKRQHQQASKLVWLVWRQPTCKASQKSAHFDHSSEAGEIPRSRKSAAFQSVFHKFPRRSPLPLICLIIGWEVICFNYDAMNCRKTYDLLRQS